VNAAVSSVESEISDAPKLQIQAYIGEYQAMMNRVNLFMSMQFMPVAPLATFLAVVAAAHAYLDVVLLAWVATGVTQIAVLVYYFALHEVYNHARYLETKLKPQVALLLGLNKDSFWAWEGQLKHVGKAYDPRYGDLAPAILSAIALIVGAGIVLTRPPISWWNCLGALVATIFVIGSIVSARRVMKVRRELETAA
jgi:energy-converting hydrogenase Eha subunit C